MNADVAALLAAIDENPDDDARYLVLADALTVAGDPHGELIMLQHALARNPDREVLRAEQAARRAAWPAAGPCRARICEATWRLGFLETLVLDGGEASIAAVVDTLGEHLATRRVRTIHATTWGAGRDAPSNLRELVVRRSRLSDRDVHQLARLPRLESLDL
ncbi:MAG: TIGR02996 domain-containing protein, partial [Proteobacteria bacterium]|nr:TIGR02996 domain-containing protein [Pseudomonadota bacterium]